MPTLVCDRTPCDEMRSALPVLIRPEPNKETLEIIVETKPYGPRKPRWIVTLRYCPFCGVRIDPDWVLDLLKAPRRLHQ